MANRVISLINGDQVALNPIDINIPEPQIDLFGRLRISQIETQVQIKQHPSDARRLTTSYGVVTAGSGLTFTEEQASFLMSTTGTSGHYRIRSRYCGLYQNGKSLLIFFTFNFTSTGTAGVLKKAGYFYGTDGIWLQQNGTTVSWVMSSSISGAPAPTVVPQSSWTGNLTFDWTKSHIGFIGFEYLGVGDIVCGFVQDRVLGITTIFNNKNTLNFPYMLSPNLFLTYEMIVSRVTTTAEQFRAICAVSLVEGGIQKIGLPFSMANTLSLNITIPANTIVPLLVFRNTIPYSRVIIDSYEILTGGDGGFETILMQADTFTNLLSGWSVFLNGVQAWEISNNTVSYTGGVILTNRFSDRTGRTASQNVQSKQIMETGFDDTPVSYAVAIRSKTSNLSVQGALVNLILET